MRWTHGGKTNIFAIRQIGLKYCEDLLTVGDTVTLGTYEICSGSKPLHDPLKKEITWIVIAREQNKLLLLSEYSLDCDLFDFEDGAIWSDSEILKTLGEWEEKLFAEEEKKHLIKTTTASEIIDDENRVIYSKPAESILFLLNTEEVEKYIKNSSSASIQAAIDSKLIMIDKFQNETILSIEHVPWWTRSVSSDKDQVVCEDEEGNYIYVFCDADEMGVRPAMRISVDKNIQTC